MAAGNVIPHVEGNWPTRYSVAVSGPNHIPVQAANFDRNFGERAEPHFIADVISPVWECAE